MKTVPGALAALAFAALAGCTAPEQRPTAPVEPRTDGHATSPEGGVTVLYLTSELKAEAALAAADQLAAVRAAVTRELGLEATPRLVPQAEIVVYRDDGSSQDYFLVTHARIVGAGTPADPIRVHIPCRIPADETDGVAIAKRFRGTVAHEIAEATVLTHVRILDPYLRWMHDGIAESVSYRVVKRLDPQAASAERDRYLENWRQARDKRIRWVDLGGWRQPSTWIVHSDAIFSPHVPLELTDPVRSFERLGEVRLATQERQPDLVATYDALASFLGEAWARERVVPGDGEADLRRPEARETTGARRFKDTQFLCYGASMCLWLELEREAPGVTARFMATLVARREAVLSSADVFAIVEQLAKVDVRGRVERFTFERLERVLQAE